MTTGTFYTAFNADVLRQTFAPRSYGLIKGRPVQTDLGTVQHDE